MNALPTYPPPTRLAEQAQRMLDVLQKPGHDWLNRKGIARALGKRRLTPYDIALLEILQDKGLVQIQSRANGTPIGYEWVYHAEPGTRVE